MGHRMSRSGAALLAAAVLLLTAAVAMAQVPPHAPGTICFTDQFWCWAQPPGPPGAPCYCPNGAEMVPGVLG